METVKTKNQKGAISMFVLMAMLFFLVTVVGICAVGQRKILYRRRRKYDF